MSAENIALEYYRADLDHYFVTVLQSEIDALDSGTFSGTRQRTHGGFAVYASRSSAPVDAAPICRFYSQTLDSHVYRVDSAECEYIEAHWGDVWKLERRHDLTPNSCPEKSGPAQSQQSASGTFGPSPCTCNARGVSGPCIRSVVTASSDSARPRNSEMVQIVRQESDQTYFL